jgi:hypothetical protein
MIRQQQYNVFWLIEEWRSIKGFAWVINFNKHRTESLLRMWEAGEWTTADQLDPAGAAVDWNCLALLPWADRRTMQTIPY